VMQHDAYILRIWRSRAVSGWQWAARLQHLPDGQSVRFSDPAALLAHLQALVRAGVLVDPAPDTPSGADGLAPSTQEGGTTEES
jgi:hypothetical protein